MYVMVIPQVSTSEMQFSVKKIAKEIGIFGDLCSKDTLLVSSTGDDINGGLVYETSDVITFLFNN